MSTHEKDSVKAAHLIFWFLIAVSFFSGANIVLCVVAFLEFFLLFFTKNFCCLIGWHRWTWKNAVYQLLPDKPGYTHVGTIQYCEYCNKIHVENYRPSGKDPIESFYYD